MSCLCRKMNKKFESPSPSRPDGRPPAPKIPYSQVQQLYNDTCTNFPRCQSVSEGRKRAIRARFRRGKGWRISAAV